MAAVPGAELWAPQEGCGMWAAGACPAGCSHMGILFPALLLPTPGPSAWRCSSPCCDLPRCLFPGAQLITNLRAAPVLELLSLSKLVGHIVAVADHWALGANLQLLKSFRIRESLQLPNAHNHSCFTPDQL